MLNKGGKSIATQEEITKAQELSNIINVSELKQIFEGWVVALLNRISRERDGAKDHKFNRQISEVTTYSQNT